MVREVNIYVIVMGFSITKIGHPGPLLVSFSPLFKFKYKMHRFFARGSNPGSKDGRCRWIHRPMTAPNKLIFFKWAIRGLFFLFSSFQYSWQKTNVNYIFCRWLDSNWGPLASEVIATPTESLLPLPKFKLFLQIDFRTHFVGQVEAGPEISNHLTK